MDSNEKNEFLLMQVILMFQTAALQHMGKLKSPLSDKIERDLQQAQASIGILEMLHKKMKGNLSSDEERYFSQVLQELKLNYVDEVSKDQNMAQEPPSASSQTSPTQS
ncbi:MAG TPA: DUF1844 domain-containing protein [Bacteroidota bacterium]|nr:DUF1844 domain-containing protein [Bacteroidota bacterium]